MQEPQIQSQKRLTAYKVWVSDILEGELVNDEFSVGFIRLNGLNVSRVNIIAALVFKSVQEGRPSAIIDDGSGRISLRSFDNPEIFGKAEVGDMAVIIGKIREFNGEKYISPEIMKRLDNHEWMSLRKAELERNPVKHADHKSAEVRSDKPAIMVDDIFTLIRRLDDGSGASIEDIISGMGGMNASEVESLARKLLENGNIFEVRPGRLKVLE